MSHDPPSRLIASGKQTVTDAPSLELKLMGSNVSICEVGQSYCTVRIRVVELCDEPDDAVTVNV
jgi:hypothetical protein